MHTLLHSVPPVLQQATADPHLHQRHSRANMGQSLMGSLLLSPGSWCAQGSVCALQESYFPSFELVLQLYSGVNHDLLQEGLCHTQVCCTQSPCLCVSPLLTHTSTGDAQTQFCLSLCGVSGSWCAQGFFWALLEPLAGMGFDSKHDFTPPSIFLGLLLCPWTWGISSTLLQHCTAAASAPLQLCASAALPRRVEGRSFFLPYSWFGCLFPHHKYRRDSRVWLPEYRCTWIFLFTKLILLYYFYY